MSKINIPTADELSERLNGLERLLTARRWERAAIVWAFTTDDDKGGRPTDETGSMRGQFPVTVREFSRMKFGGLASRNTVAKYRENWQIAIDAGKASNVGPGDTGIELPDMDWPATGNSHGIADDVKASAPPEEKAKVALKLVNDPAVANVFDDQRREEMYRRSAQAAADRMEKLREKAGKEKTQDTRDPLASPEQEKARIERITQNDPVSRRFDQDEHADRLMKVLKKIVEVNEKHVEQINDCLRGMGDNGIGAFAELAGFNNELMNAHKATDELKYKLDEVDRFRATGRTDMDAGLSEILKNGK